MKAALIHPSNRVAQRPQPLTINGTRWNTFSQFIFPELALSRLSLVSHCAAASVVNFPTLMWSPGLPIPNSLSVAIVSQTRVQQDTLSPTVAKGPAIFNLGHDHDIDTSTNRMPDNYPLRLQLEPEWDIASSVND